MEDEYCCKYKPVLSGPAYVIKSNIYLTENQTYANIYKRGGDRYGYFCDYKKIKRE